MPSTLATAMEATPCTTMVPTSRSTAAPTTAPTRQPIPARLNNLTLDSGEDMLSMSVVSENSAYFG
jgi:hypothetical protein